jgi:hypothetical protein
VDRAADYHDPQEYRSLVLARGADLDSLVAAGADLWIVKAKYVEEWKRRLRAVPEMIASEGRWRLYFVRAMPRMSDD